MKFKKRTWIIIVVLIRVIVTLGIMMTLFLGMWIGYFTIPIILIGVFSIILAISDIGILISLGKGKDLLLKEPQIRGIKDDQIKTKNIITNDGQ